MSRPTELPMGMTRAAEFCYIAEFANDTYLLGIVYAQPALKCLWTNNMDMALRMTANGRNYVAQAVWQESQTQIGFRRILVE